MRILCLLVLGCGAVCGMGCGPQGALGQINVKSARLEAVNITTAAAIFGFATGDATLVVVDKNDDEHSFDATLGGPVLGMLIDGGTGSTAEQDACGFQAVFDFTNVEGDKTGDKILGLYGGSKTSTKMAIGIEGHDLENPAKVGLDMTLSGVGMGMFAGYEWLTVDSPDGKQ